MRLPTRWAAFAAFAIALSSAATVSAAPIVVDPNNLPGVVNGGDVSNAFLDIVSAGAGVKLTAAHRAGSTEVTDRVLSSFVGFIGDFWFGWDNSPFDGDEHWDRNGEAPVFTATLVGFATNRVQVGYGTDGDVMLEAYGTGGLLGTVGPDAFGDLFFETPGDDIVGLKVLFSNASDFAGVHDLTINAAAVVAVPEPASVALLAAGLAAVWLRRRRTL